VFLQFFDAVGWVLRPVKTVARITYTVLVETLNPAQSVNQSVNHHFLASCMFFAIRSFHVTILAKDYCFEQIFEEPYRNSCFCFWMSWRTL